MAEEAAPRVTIELVPAEQGAFRGRLLIDELPAASFSGWLELITALEHWKARVTEDRARRDE